MEHRRAGHVADYLAGDKRAFGENVPGDDAGFADYKFKI
jgi:hypothetical protein